jgi:hypothetical protein
MVRFLANAGMLFALALVATAAEDTPKPQADAGENYLSLEVDGCGDKCAEFEIQIFETGRLLFTPKNSKNSTKIPFRKSGMGSVYDRVAKYLQDTGALAQPAECAAQMADAPVVAIVQSVKSSQVQKATWSARSRRHAPWSRCS